jgi:hypothetical protein
MSHVQWWPTFQDTLMFFGGGLHSREPMLSGGLHSRILLWAEAAYIPGYSYVQWRPTFQDVPCSLVAYFSGCPMFSGSLHSRIFLYSLVAACIQGNRCWVVAYIPGYFHVQWRRAFQDVPCSVAAYIPGYPYVQWRPTFQDTLMFSGGLHSRAAYARPVCNTARERTRIS